MNVIALRAPKCLAFDASEKIGPLLLDELVKREARGIGRYVPLPGVNPALDIDQRELEGILARGLGSWWYQHPRFPGWRPREHDPEVDALHAATFAKAAGYAPLTHGYVDAEGMNSDTTWQEAHFYNSRWTHVIVEEGFSGGLYDGYSEPETPMELYEIHDATSYASDAADRRIAIRGTALVQRPQIKILGVDFDPVDVAPDLIGETPYWSFAA